ncbi:MAG TPA: DNA-directed RNA polymerase subunit alpha C-terminal domain-containing protein [Sulfuriferula sp.]|nr:DNA-directed RNA polymerase subunit alpha C-terminal domain-containing protein [Sulfuriferula sp.]
MREAWNPYLGRGDTTGIIHVGLDRPETETFESCAMRHRGQMLLSASARWALMSVCKCAARAVGEAAGIPLYVAVNGWGYETSAEAMGLADSVLAVSTKSESFTPEQLGGIPHPFPNVEDITSNNWLANLSCDDADLAMAASKAQVVDEYSYWEGEVHLPVPLRHALGLYRYRVLSMNDEPDDPMAVIRHAPPWLLSVNLHNLNLSVRAFNVFGAAALSVVGDLTEISLEKLQKLPNFGRTSQQHFAERLRAAIERGPSIIAPSSSTPTATEALNVVASNSLSAEKLGSQFQNHNTLPSVIFAAISSLDSNLEKAVRGRMGLGVDHMTLEELGGRMGVTRERIRQREAKGMHLIGLDPIWKGVLEAKLSNLLDERDDPLPFSGLAILDPWFQGVEQMQHSFSYLLEHKNILDQRLSLLQANGQWFVSRLSQRGWNLAAKQAMHLLEGGVAQGWHQAEARQYVEDLLSGAGHELRSELWIAAKRFAHFSSADNGGESVLIGYGKSVDVLVEAILADSDRPLHFQEIARVLYERYGRNVDVRRAHNSAGDCAFLYGRGTFGLLKHCPLSTNELELVREETQEIIAQGTSGRQWTCAELVNVLSEQGLDLDGRLNHFVLNIALRDSRELAYLGRFVWTLSTNASLGTAHRINMRQAVTSLLMQAGGPMTTSEIKEALMHDRGLGDTFQLHPGGSLIRVNSSQWGLIERDFPLDSREQAQLIEVLQSLLREQNKGIHVSEIAACLDGIFEPISRIKYPTAILALAQRSGRLRVSVGEYLFLPEWGEPRRIQKSQAVIEALKQADSAGLRASEIVNSASAILGRPVERDGIYATLYDAGARFDETTQRWRLPNTKESEDEETLA